MYRVVCLAPAAVIPVLYECRWLLEHRISFDDLFVNNDTSLVNRFQNFGHDGTSITFKKPIFARQAVSPARCIRPVHVDHRNSGAFGPCFVNIPCRRIYPGARPNNEDQIYLLATLDELVDRIDCLLWEDFAKPDNPWSKQATAFGALGKIFDLEFSDFNSVVGNVIFACKRLVIQSVI